tara:strand:+ start:2033 stop:2275 length:243 start_codon:yes stop_codon:yes gene_type:complete
MENEEKMTTEQLVENYNTLLGEYNKLKKMLDKLAIQVAQHTVEVAERDVVIDTLRDMVRPEQEVEVNEAIAEAVDNGEEE